MTGVQTVAKGSAFGESCLAWNRSKCLVVNTCGTAMISERGGVGCERSAADWQASEDAVLRQGDLRCDQTASQLMVRI